MTNATDRPGIVMADDKSVVNIDGQNFYARDDEDELPDELPPYEVPPSLRDRFSALQLQIEATQASQARLEEKLDQILIIAKDVQDKAQPLIDSLKSSPILKMMGVGQ